MNSKDAREITVRIAKEVIIQMEVYSTLWIPKIIQSNSWLTNNKTAMEKARIWISSGLLTILRTTTWEGLWTDRLTDSTVWAMEATTSPLSTTGSSPLSTVLCKAKEIWLESRSSSCLKMKRRNPLRRTSVAMERVHSSMPRLKLRQDRRQNYCSKASHLCLDLLSLRISTSMLWQQDLELETLKSLLLEMRHQFTIRIASLPENQTLEWEKLVINW